jgi:ABC-2 type transport system ATP-binding protein
LRDMSAGFQPPQSNQPPVSGVQAQQGAKATMPLPTVSQTQPVPQPQQPPMIYAQNVTKRIGEKVLVENLTFDVRQGEIFGFIGPSGSGKTSTIRLLTGVYTPTEGDIRVMGVSPSHPSRRVQERLGYMPQLFVLYPNLTVRENLDFVAGIYGLNPFRRGRRIEQLLKFVELWEARDRLAANVSGGMQRRIELAAALLHNPPLLFVDEPTAGIDPILRSKFWEEFRRLRDEGRTVFVTTQYVGESEHCDRVGVIRRGRLIALDAPANLRRRALGGEVIDIEAADLSPTAIQTLLEPPFVRDIKYVSRNEIRVHVEDAGVAIPPLMEILNNNNCTVSRIEEYRPSFDEVFVELMKRDAAERGEPEGGEQAA